MTIKVTHRGTPPSEIQYNGRCDVCQSTMQCVAADGELRSDQRERDTWVDIRCPVCGAAVHCYAHKLGQSFGTHQFD